MEPRDTLTAEMEPEIFDGEVIEQKPHLRFDIRLDDGRVLSECWISGRPRGGIPENMLPKVGECVRVEENPYSPGQGRIILRK